MASSSAAAAAAATGSGSLARWPNATLLVEPRSGFEAVDQFVAAATTSVDITMYELADPVFEADLAADAARGVDVRVLLDQAYHGAEVNEPAYGYLRAHGVHARWANASAILHQKTITVDDTESLIATFNLVSKYASSSRNLGYFDTDPADVAAIVATFAHDWSGLPPAPAPGGSGDLVWSPGSTSRLVALIDSAATSLDVESEEIADQPVVDALVSACRRGVDVHVVMEADPQWDPVFDQIVAAGGHVVTYPASARLYIHAKFLVIDDSVLWLGSENFSVASLVYNRELGIVIDNAPDVHEVASVFASDVAGGEPYREGATP